MYIAAIRIVAIREPTTTKLRMSEAEEISQRVSLREQVERLLPAWRSWYPSLFDAAQDLGLIRARVCAPSSLLLGVRHASIQNEALQAFREQWSVEEEPALQENTPSSIAQNRRGTQGGAQRRNKRKRPRNRSA